MFDNNEDVTEWCDFHLCSGWLGAALLEFREGSGCRLLPLLFCDADAAGEAGVIHCGHQEQHQTNNRGFKVTCVVSIPDFLQLK